MAISKIFSLEGNSLEVTFFAEKTPHQCSLCYEGNYRGYAVSHFNGSELVFCETCFQELKEAIAFVIYHEEGRN